MEFSGLLKANGRFTALSSLSGYITGWLGFTKKKITGSRTEGSATLGMVRVQDWDGEESRVGVAVSRAAGQQARELPTTRAEESIIIIIISLA